MLTEVQQYLLMSLKEIKERRVSDVTGICGNVRLWFNREFIQGQITDRCYISYSGELKNNISKWLEETGSRLSTTVYPVGGAAQFRDELEAGTIWNNPKRWELLNWMINRLEALDK